MRPGDGHPASENVWHCLIGKCHLNAPICPANKNYAFFPFSSFLEEGGITSGFWDWGDLFIFLAVTNCAQASFCRGTGEIFGVKCWCRQHGRELNITWLMLCSWLPLNNSCKDDNNKKIKGEKRGPVEPHHRMCHARALICCQVSCCSPPPNCSSSPPQLRCEDL